MQQQDLKKFVFGICSTEPSRSQTNCNPTARASVSLCQGGIPATQAPQYRWRTRQLCPLRHLRQAERPSERAHREKRGQWLREEVGVVTATTTRSSNVRFCISTTARASSGAPAVTAAGHPTDVGAGKAGVLTSGVTEVATGVPPAGSETRMMPFPQGYSPLR